jgi:hypothetical protein
MKGLLQARTIETTVEKREFGDDNRDPLIPDRNHFQSRHRASAKPAFSKEMPVLTEITILRMPEISRK